MSCGVSNYARGNHSQRVHCREGEVLFFFFLVWECDVDSYNFNLDQQLIKYSVDTVLLRSPSFVNTNRLLA
jgi:hypothetical protein